MRKVTVIGAGNVGATIAYTLAVEGVANEIVIIDIKKEKAEGEAAEKPEKKKTTRKKAADKAEEKPAE